MDRVASDQNSMLQQGQAYCKRSKGSEVRDRHLLEKSRHAASRNSSIPIYSYSLQQNRN